MQPRVRLDLSQHLEAVHFRHFQVEQDENRIFIFTARESAAAKEIVKSLATVPRGNDLIDQLVLFQGVQNEFDIV